MDKIVSSIISIIYLIIAYISGGGESLLKTFAFLLLPLACIWFSNEIGRYTGYAGHGLITRESPGVLVKFFGWILLLLPVIIGIIIIVIS